MSHHIEWHSHLSTEWVTFTYYWMSDIHILLNEWHSYLSTEWVTFTYYWMSDIHILLNKWHSYSPELVTFVYYWMSDIHILLTEWLSHHSTDWVREINIILNEWPWNSRQYVMDHYKYWIMWFVLTYKQHSFRNIHTCPISDHLWLRIWQLLHISLTFRTTRLASYSQTMSSDKIVSTFGSTKLSSLLLSDHELWQDRVYTRIHQAS